jgi:hypothetical protein
MNGNWSQLDMTRRLGASTTLAGLFTGGLFTLLGTRMWARRIEAGQAILRPKRGS